AVDTAGFLQQFQSLQLLLLCQWLHFQRAVRLVASGEEGSDVRCFILWQLKLRHAAARLDPLYSSRQCCQHRRAVLLTHATQLRPAVNPTEKPVHAVAGTAVELADQAPPLTEQRGSRDLFAGMATPAGGFALHLRWCSSGWLAPVNHLRLPGLVVDRPAFVATMA